MAAIAFPSGRRRMAALCVVLTVGGCSGAWPEETRAGCRSFTLTVEGTGETVRGPEDLVWDPVSRHLLVSADPRGRDGRPGLYSVAIDTLRTAADKLRLTPVADVREPHGIGLDVERRELAVVDHVDEDGQGGAAIRRFTVGADGKLTDAGIYGRVRNANDVVPDGRGGVYVTQDHAGTGLAGAWELMTSQKRAAIHRLPVPDAGGEATVVRGGLYFANGITRDGDRLYVSEMRAERVLVYDGALSGTLSPAGEIPLPGQPDNLNLDEDGGHLLAAVLPEPFVLFLALKGLLDADHIASAAVGMALPTGEAHTLFGDPDGETVSAATAVEAADGLLVLGSVVAPTLAVCPLPPVSR
ncbi:MAG: hypothetical protein LDL26_04840 [Caenispirillum bisanense]|nr:hypothetical protein [Caenispirillum bisanense]MCA1972715.1 hypothetical protein [Caenispirillum sp.]